MNKKSKNASKLVDDLFSEMSKFDDENLSFHNLVVAENLREIIVDLKNSLETSSVDRREEQELPPLPLFEEESAMYSVAIIDDDQDTQNLLKFYFKKHDIAVVSYLSAIDALAEMGKKKYDLLLVDLMMPEMTGFEFIQKVKKKIDINETKIIVGSAKSNQLDRMNALKMGALDFIGKPYDLSELVLIIKRNLESNAA